MPSTVVWTLGGNTLTWANGWMEHAPEDYTSYVLFDRLADGEVDAENLGLSGIEVRHGTFKNVDATTVANFKTWRNTTVNGPLNTFTHTDNSKATPEVLTVRIILSKIKRLMLPGTTPVYEVEVALQREPGT